MTSYELTRFKKMVWVWKTKSPLYCLRYDPLIIFQGQNHTVKFRKKAPGLCFSKASFEGLIFGGAYIRRGLSTEGNLRFKIDWASLIVGSEFTVLLCFTLYLRAIFQVQAPRGLYLEGWFNGGLFALPVWGLIFGGSYTWRGLFSEFYGNFHIPKKWYHMMSWCKIMAY